MDFVLNGVGLSILHTPITVCGLGIANQYLINKYDILQLKHELVEYVC